MAEQVGKGVNRNANSVAVAGPGKSETPLRAVNDLSCQDSAALTAAQKEYIESMRISVQQMNQGDGRPLGELLSELREEPMG